jgi:hypothetical protein
VPPNKRFGQDFRTSCQIKGAATFMGRAATSLRGGSSSLGMRLLVPHSQPRAAKVQIWGEPVPHNNTSEFRLLGGGGRDTLVTSSHPDPKV